MRIRLVTVVGLIIGLIGALPVPRAVAEPVLDPSSDPFYAAPSDLASLVPGTVIRRRSVTASFGSRGGLGLPLPARATQILVRSTDSKGRPIAAAATILTPLFGARHQLLAWSPAIDSLGARCQPSYTLRAGITDESPAIAQMLMSGLTVVVPDHEGPRHAFAASRVAGHVVLDSVRGALATPAASLRGAATEVALFGYSGGAIATTKAAELEPTYAPEINLVGAAAGGTPADLHASARLMDGKIAGGLFVAGAIGVSREYPELLSIMNDRGRAMVEEFRDLCKVELALRPTASVTQMSDHPDPLHTPVAETVLRDNALGLTPPTAPVYLWHSRWDELNPWGAAVRMRDSWCAGGADVRFTTDYTSEHLSGAGVMMLTAVPWLMDRFNGRAFRGNCPG